MRKASLALSCFLLAGAAFAQQAPSTSSSSPAAAPAAKVPVASNRTGQPSH